MSKKEIERLYVEWFAEKIGWDSCEIIDDEVPDFGIKLPDRIIGLEVTNLFKDEARKGSSFKHNETHRKKWLSEVSEKYYKISETPLKVNVLVRAGELEGHSDSLSLELAQRNNIKVHQRAEFDFKPTNKCNLKISFVRLPRNFDKYKRWTMIDNHIGFSREIEKALLQEKIQNKAAKLPKYKEKYRKVILLIVTDRTYESGMFHASSDKISSLTYGFSSVYLALYPEKYIKIG